MMYFRNILMALTTIPAFFYADLFGQVNFQSDSLKKHVYILASDSLEGRGLSTQGGKMAAGYIVEQFKKIGLPPAGDDYLQPFYVRQGQTTLTGNNIIGIIEGNDPELKNEYILIGAHYDHISFQFIKGEKVVFNGADDNASGTAAIIEIAAELIKQKDRLKRSIIIAAFDGEESGLLGSFEFADQEIIPMYRIRLMMSLDMVGRYGEGNSLRLGGLGMLKEGQEILSAIEPGFDGITIVKKGRRLSRRTDTKPFGLEGIPALHVTTGIKGPYHKPEDDPATIDFAGMKTVCNFLYDFTVEASTAQKLSPIKQLSFQAKNDGVAFFRYGIKMNTGISYHYYPQRFYNARISFAYEFGIMTQLNFFRFLSLKPELLFSSLGSQIEQGSFRANGLTVPVSLMLTSRMNKQFDYRSFAQLGGYYSYHLGGHYNFGAMAFGTKVSQREAGITLGAGIEVSSLFLELNFKFGLTNLMVDDNLDVSMTRATFFTVGYMFR